MASIKNLKKDINYLFGDILDAVDIWEITNNKINSADSQSIADEAADSYYSFLEEINNKKVENRIAHLKEVNKNIEKKARELVDKINQLS